MAIREIERDDDHMITKIMSMRAFAHAKHQYDNAKSKFDLPRNRMIDLVIEFDLALPRDTGES